MSLGGRDETCMEGTALVKKRSRTGAAVENVLFPWCTKLCGQVLVKSEVEGEGKRDSSEDLQLLCKEQQQTVAQAYPCSI